MKQPPLIVLAAGGLLAAVVLVAFLAPPVGASAPNVQAASGELGSAHVTTKEADAWAEARAADTPAAYRVYLAAYPSGAFKEEAQDALDRASGVRRTNVSVPAPVVHRPSRAEIASSCRSYVDATLPAPSRVARIGGGAAGGCGVGLLAGGNDGRNCAIGAVVGGGVGAITAENRDRRRREELNACIANGGPPG